MRPGQVYDLSESQNRSVTRGGMKGTGELVGAARVKVGSGPRGVVDKCDEVENTVTIEGSIVLVGVSGCNILVQEKQWW